MVNLIGRVAPLAALVLVLAGCTGADRTAAGSPATSPAPPSSPVASTPVPATPSTSPSVRPCQPTKAWTQTHALNWVRAVARTDLYRNVVLDRDNAPATLCQGMAVQVEFWNVVLSSLGTLTSFTLRPAQRKQVTIDGRRTVTVKAPKDFEARDCGGILTAVYLGKPLTESELPSSLPDVNAGPVEFNTDRVAISLVILPESEGSVRACQLPL